MLWIAAGVAVVLSGAPQREAESEMQLEAATYRGIVMGDLKGAIDQYRAILAQPGTPKPVAARAAFLMSESLERLGRRAEARAAYARVVNTYGDQAPAASARERLANWEISLPGPRNIDFEEGVPGKVPPDWFVPALPKDANDVAELRRDGCHGGSGCAVVRVPKNAPSPFGHLMQSFGATAYRGKTVRLRAWLRLESVLPLDRSQMWLSVDRANRQQGFLDRIDDHPVGGWTRFEIVGQIDEDATFITFGVASAGTGRVWVDDVSFEVINR